MRATLGLASMFAAALAPIAAHAEFWLPDVLPDGIYRIKQLSTSRFLDAHEQSSNDYGIVTRARQEDDTQKWRVTVLNHCFPHRCHLIQQLSNDRYMDAYETSSHDFKAVTRGSQTGKNRSQEWIIYQLANPAYGRERLRKSVRQLLPNSPNGKIYIIRHYVPDRFLMTHLNGSHAVRTENKRYVPITRYWAFIKIEGG